MPKRPPENLHEILRGLVGSGFSGNQQKMCSVLKEHGFKVNQSTVSRALRRIGAVKSSGPNGRGYELQPPKISPDFSRGIASLVHSFDHNGMMIILHTTPGAAMFVAGFIDRACGEHAMGTVAGDDTIFVAPSSLDAIDHHMEAIRDTISRL